MANKRFRRFRKTVRKNITRKTVKKMINNEKNSRDWDVSVNKSLDVAEYTYVRTISPDLVETGKSTYKTIDFGLCIPQDNVYRVIVWQQLTTINRNNDTSNWTTSRNLLNNVLDIDIGATASNDAAMRDIISPWDAYESGKTVKVLYDKIVLQDANGNGMPQIQRFHIPGRKLKPLYAPPYQEASAIVGSVMVGIIVSAPASKIMIESRCQYTV